MAGVAGALLTQANQFVGLNVLGLEPSGELLVMLILGGVGRLYGAFVGPVGLPHRAGLPRQAVSRVLVLRHRRAADRGRAVRARRRPRHASINCGTNGSALETEKLCKSFGALTVADNIDFRLEAGARHALIGPNGAGKTTFVNMLTGALAPTSGRILLSGEDSHASRARRRA